MITIQNTPARQLLVKDSQVGLPSDSQVQLRASQRETLDSIPMSFAEKSALFVPASIIAMADTFAESFGLVDEQDMEQFLLKNTDELGRFFVEHRGSVGAVGDIAGAFIPGTIALKAVRSTGFLGRLATKYLGEGAQKYFSTGMSNKALFEKTYQQARLTAYKGAADVSESAAYTLAKKSALRRSVADTVIESVAADVLIAGTMRESEFLFPEQLSFADHLAWFAGTNAIIAGGALGIARHVMRVGVNRAIADGKIAASNVNDLLSSEAPTNIVGLRGPAIAIHAQLLDDVEKQLVRAKSTGDSETISYMEKQKAAIEQRLKDLTEKSFRDSPLQDVTHSTTLAKGAGEVDTMRAAYKQDPSLTLGLQSLEKFDIDNIVGFELRLAERLEKSKVKFKELQPKIDKYKKKGDNITRKQERQLQKWQQQAEKTRQEIAQLEKTTAVVVELDGTTTGISKRARIFQDSAREIAAAAEGSAARVGERYFIVSKTGDAIVAPDARTVDFDIDPFGNLQGKGEQVKDLTDDVFRSLTHEEKTAMFDAAQKSIEAANIETWKGMSISADSPFLKLDFAAEMIAKHEDVAVEKIVNFTSLDDLNFNSLRRKFNLYQRLRRDAATTGPSHIYYDRNNLATALNLPRDNHAILNFFESNIQLHKTIDLRDLTKNMDEFREAIRAFADLPPDAQLANMATHGSMLNLPRERKPVIAVLENTANRAGLQPEDLSRRVYQIRAEQAEKLKSAKTIFVKNIMDVIAANKDAITQFKRDLYAVLAGNESSSPLTRDFVQQNFRFRDEPAFRSADVLADTIDRQHDKMIEKLLDSPTAHNSQLTYQQAFNRILANDATVDLNMAMVARHAIGAGWDIAKREPFVATSGRGETVFHLALDPNSTRNKEIWRKMFGEAMPEGENVYLPVTNERKAVTVTQKGKDALNAMNDLSQILFAEHSALHNARNMRVPRKKAFHLAAQDLSSVYRSYLVDRAGKLVAVVGGQTKAELRRNVQQEIEASGHTITEIPEGSVQRYYDARAKAFFEMSDFSKLSNQTGAATGKSFGSVVQTGPEAFKAMLETTLRQFSDISRETRVMLFEPEIQYLRLQKAATGAKDTERTVYDELVSRIAGVQNLDPESIVGKSLLAVESIYDAMLHATYNNIIAKLPSSGLKESRARKRFAEAETRLKQEHLPWKSVEDYLQRTRRAGVPATLRKHSALMNEVTTAATIRIFDVGMGVINMVSLAATLPPVIAMVAKQTGETSEEWSKRIAAFGVVTPKDNAYFSPTKAIIDAIHFATSPEGRELIDRARSKGFFDQFAAEQIEIFSRTGETFVPGALRSFAKATSVITDSTERAARAWSFVTMYNIGKKGLGLTDDAAMTFAHAQANNTIADFRPANRPAIFQGAAGMPLGLFTTYMWNYLQRMLRIVETADVRSGAIQVGLQASLFGSESIPGWDLYTNTFLDNYDGSYSVVDRLNEAMGPMAADMFLNGTVSNLPYLFGIDGRVSIGPRAAVGIPFRSGFSTESVAGLRMLGRVSTAASELIDSTIENKGLNTAQTAEILAQANVNKFLSNAIELGLGHSLDYSGSIIEKNTRTSIGVAARAIGFKPLFADELRQENVRNRATERVQSELKERLANKLKSQVRNGKLKASDVEDALESYVRAGGNAENFKRFFQSQLLRGTTSKLELELVDAIRGSIDKNRIGRLLYLSRD